MELQFIEPEQLRPTEEHDPDAVIELAAKIAREGVWSAPLLIHRGNLAILDGHHRWQVAIRMQLCVVPCFICAYHEDNVRLGTWRPDYHPTASDVFRAAATGLLFPRKTTRHHPPQLGLAFAIPLGLLKWHGQPAVAETLYLRDGAGPDATSGAGQRRAESRASAA